MCAGMLASLAALYAAAAAAEGPTSGWAGELRASTLGRRVTLAFSHLLTPLDQVRWCTAPRLWRLGMKECLPEDC